MRVGAAALGLFAGGAVGALLGWVSLVTGAETSLALFVFGGAGAGALSGLVYPESTMFVVEAVVHFFVGFFATTAEHVVTPERDAPPLLRLALLFGVCFAVFCPYCMASNAAPPAFEPSLHPECGQASHTIAAAFCNASPSLRPKCYGWLRQPPPSGELKR